MTREEEIKEAAKYYGECNPIYDIDVCGDFTEGDWETVASIFERGAKWADEHPRKGLVDIDKVYKYLKNLGYQQYPGAPMERILDDEELEDFKRAMEE